MSKKKYTKCQCCSYYEFKTSSKKWRCSRSYCIFSYTDKESQDRCAQILDRWINANKGD